MLHVAGLMRSAFAVLLASGDFSCYADVIQDVTSSFLRISKSVIGCEVCTVMR